jgi:hypothetical protein
MIALLIKEESERERKEEFYFILFLIPLCVYIYIERTRKIPADSENAKKEKKLFRKLNSTPPHSS